MDSEAAPEANSAEPVLTPKLSPAWGLRLWQLPCVVLLGLVFLIANYLPLRPTDLWGHVSWGHWIISHQQLPAEDPFFKLAQGMPVVDSAWLSQIIFAAIDRAGGPQWLSNAFALVTLATWLVLWRVLYLRTNNWLSSFLMLAVVFALAWSRLTTIRPENFAWLSFALLWWCLQSDQSRPADSRAFRWQVWIGVPLVMVLWANLHGSFICGLLVLGAYALGEAISAWWRTRSLRAMLSSRDVQVYFFVAELAVLATLVNPYGIDLHLTTLVFARNENLRDVLEWQPLSFGATASYEFVAAWVLAMLLLRFSRRPVAPAHVILLAAFGLATLGGNRMIGWFAVVYGVAFAPLLDDLVTRPAWIRAITRPAAEGEEVSRGLTLWGRSWSYSLVACLLVWIAFALSPASLPVLGGKPRAAAQIFGGDTPLGLTDYLAKNPIQGNVYCPQWWGDWLVRTSAEIQPMMTTNIHLAPRQVWLDYNQISSVRAGWPNVLGRYAIRHVVVDKKHQQPFAAVLRRDTSLQLLYEDDQAALYGLSRPLPQSRGQKTEDKGQEPAPQPTTDN